MLMVGKPIGFQQLAIPSAARANVAHGDKRLGLNGALGCADAHQLILGKPSVSAAESVCSASFDRLLPGRALMHAIEPCVEIGIARQLLLRPRHLGDKTHLDVGAGKLFAEEKWLSIK